MTVDFLIQSTNFSRPANRVCLTWKSFVLYFSGPFLDNSWLWGKEGGLYDRGVGVEWGYSIGVLMK